MDRGDLKNHMQVQEYWVPHKKGIHTQRFGKGAKSGESCWCIQLDRHEMGLINTPDEEFKASLHPQEGEFMGREDIFLKAEDWVDPRKGDLFVLVESLNITEPEGDNSTQE